MDLLALIETCAPQVAPTTMQKIINVESGKHPHAIGYKITRGKDVFTLTKQPENIVEARSWATYLLQNGYKFDAGIAQINSANFARLGLTAHNVFDPCENISASGKILTEFYKIASTQYGHGQPALLAAISAYNSGNFRTGFSNGYVQKVVNSTTKAAGTPPPIRLVQAASPHTERPSVHIENYRSDIYTAELEAKSF